MHICYMHMYSVNLGVFSFLVTQGCAGQRNYFPFSYEQIKSGSCPAGKHVICKGTGYITWFDTPAFFFLLVVALIYNGC